MFRKKRTRRLAQRPNLWVAFSVLFLISVFTVVTMMGPGTVTGNTVQPISRLNKGDPLHLAVKDVPGLETVFITAKENIKGGQVTVLRNDGYPFDREYFSKFQVSSDQPEKYGPLRFTFKVKELDLYEKGISRDDLRLYHNGKEYPLQLLKYSYGYLYFVGNVPSMGNFVLGRVAVAENVTAVAEKKPGEALPETEVPAPAVEEPEEMPEEELPLAGKAAELPAEREEKSFWTRITDFFRRLFT
mgnify:CR=1 FL=1